MPRVHGFDAFRVAMPHGRRPESIIVKLTGDDGTVGWGEVALPAGAESTWADIEERLGPALLEVEWERPEDMAGVAQLAGRRAAAAVDIACWDLWCRSRGVPVAHALGGTRTAIVTGARVAAEPPLDTLTSRVNRYTGGGFARITVAIRPGWDIEPVRAIRHAFPALALVADAGGRYSESREHLTTLEALDSYGLMAIEHPFPAGDLAAHARLQLRTATSICPDIGDLDDLGAAISAGAGRALSLRVDRLGGLTAARGAHDRAYAAGWDIWCGGAGPFGIGQAATVAVASLPGCTLPSDVSEIAGGPAFVSPPVRGSGGVVAVPLTQPGLGHDIDDDRIAGLATRTLRIPA
ncbi:enolase C-terminal domain-like protein [Actinomadura alba]|uniref:enolase C-terminal domain-like protein n=1 Tax=Actinomadura alba TaxID=406431 RepID=UPI0031D91EEB